jgi:DNA-binding LacI/PurR family transcriptional regulator
VVEHATIYDVASRAGVSISTASHTLNRPQRVNADTRRRSRPFTSYASYTRRLMGIIKEAEGDATEIVVYDQESAASVTSPLLSSLPVTRRLDGLLIMGLPVDDVLAERLLAQNLPTVLIDSTRPEVDLVVRATT